MDAGKAFRISLLHAAAEAIVSDPTVDQMRIDHDEWSLTAMLGGGHIITHIRKEGDPGVYVTSARVEDFVSRVDSIVHELMDAG